MGAAISQALAPQGLDAIGAADRLDAFNAVRNTYLSIFQALGGLGMLLGAAAMGMVVLRNVLQRRGELAILRAVGFTRSRLLALVAGEHVWLLFAGMVAGAVCAVVAIVPALRSSAAAVPYASGGLMLLAIVAAGVLATVLATACALRGRLIEALRAE